MRYLPKIQQLKVFQQVIRSGSIRGAARALGQSQPAVSRTIRELEQVLQTQLIIRSTHGMTLTETGLAFSRRMQLILEELQRAAHEIQQLDQLKQGSVAIGCSSLLSLTVLPALVDAFRQSFSQSNVFIHEAQLSTLLPALREGRLDFAVGTVCPELPLDDLICEPLFSAEFCIVSHKDNPLSRSSTFGELLEAKWILPKTDMGYYQQVQLEWSELYQHLITPAVHTDSFISGMNMVLETGYLVVVARAMVRSIWFQQQLAILPINNLPQAKYCVLWSQKSPLTNTARRFLDLLRDHCTRYNWL